MANPHAGGMSLKNLDNPNPHGGMGLPSGHGNTGNRSGFASLNEFGKAIQIAYRALGKNDHKSAEQAFKKALAIKDDAATRASLSESLYKQNKLAEAVKEIEIAKAKGPEEPQVKWVFGLVMLANKTKTSEAMEAWRSLIVEEPDFATQLDLKSKLKEAEAAFNK